MKITKMALNKSALAAMFLMMTSAYSINVQAGVCEAELSKHLQEKEILFSRVAGSNFQYKKEEILHRYEQALESGKFWDDETLPNAIENSIKTRARYANFVDPTTAPDYIAENEYSYCMEEAQLDGTLKSTKQAKNSKTKNTAAESKQSQSANANSQDATDNDSSNNKPLTKAELKAQKAEQQAQQDEQQAQQATQVAQVAQEHQTKANQKRQGKRRRHEPENEAHKCISPDFGGLYGGMENTCNFKVWYTYCGYRPTENSWLTGMSCEKQSFGSDIVGPGKQSASHTHGVEKLYWFACKDPAWPVDVEFVDGDIKGRCHTVGGGSD